MNKLLDKITKRFYLRIQENILLVFCISLYFIIEFARSVGRGYNTDGVTYATLARNLSVNVGTFWKPHYTNSCLNVFWEHPPFTLYFQSLLFRLIGDTTFTEFLWGVLMGLGVIIFIILFWKELIKLVDNKTNLNVSDNRSVWIPILLFISIPMVAWSYSNNLLENTMSLFSTASAYFITKAIRHTVTPGKEPTSLLYAFICGIMLWLGLFTKGFPSLFPLAIPVFSFFIFRKVKLTRVIVVTFVALFGLAIFTLFTYLLSGKDFLEFSKFYLNSQILLSIKGQRGGIPTSKFFLVKRLASELIVPFFVALVVYVIAQLVDAKKSFSFSRGFFFTLIIALSASVPLFFVPKQMVWYLVPSLPFYVIAIAVLIKSCNEPIERFLYTKNIRVNVLVWLSVLCLMVSFISVVFFREAIIPKYRNPSFYHDMLLNNSTLPTRVDVLVCPKDLMTNFGLVALMARHYQISFSLKKEKYAFVEINDPECATIVNACKLINMKPEKYGFLDCKI